MASARHLVKLSKLAAKGDKAALKLFSKNLKAFVDHLLRSRVALRTRNVDDSEYELIVSEVEREIHDRAGLVSPAEFRNLVAKVIEDVSSSADEDIEKCLNLISDDFSRALDVFRKGGSSKDIAAELGSSEEEAKRIFLAAMRRLRDCLTEHGSQ